MQPHGEAVDDPETTKGKAHLMSVKAKTRMPVRYTTRPVSWRRGDGHRLSVDLNRGYGDEQAQTRRTSGVSDGPRTGSSCSHTGRKPVRFSGAMA